MDKRFKVPWGVWLRLAAIVAFVAVTNQGFLDRTLLLIDQNRPLTLVVFLGIWGLALLALLIAAFQPNPIVRVCWAALFSAATALGYGFRRASGTDLGIMEGITFWALRNDAPRAIEFYATEILVAAAFFVVGCLVLALPPVPEFPAIRHWLNRLKLVPVIPVAVIAAVIFLREGGGHQALPIQFTPLSVSAVSGVVLAQSPTPEREDVQWDAGERQIQNIVILMDESVRPDYLDWEDGNSYTPQLARHRDRFINYGPAAAGSTCSAYANAMLRFAAAKDDLGGALLTNPTIWQYAKSAGFRTVFIDAQAGFMKDPGRLHSYMTVEESSDIDSFHLADESIPDAELDFALLDIMEQELASEEPTFIYAIKTGVHFPYDRTYPESEIVFEPTMTQAGHDSTRVRINSYRNGIRWAVGHFFERFFEQIDLSETLVIYTADHGQNFDINRFTHCSVEDPDPREGLVPLHAITDAPELRNRLESPARISHGHANHFQIVPTILELMGYPKKDIDGAYGPSMFERARGETAFTYGDVLGLFSDDVKWQQIDLTADYLEDVEDGPDEERGPAFWPRTVLSE